MSYIDRYNKFIDSLRNQVVSEGCELHHIVPRSMGGSDDKSNIIALTPRQHYIAHWMLWKAYGGKMAQAFFFINNNKNKRIGSRAYKKLRDEAIDQISGANHYLFGKSIPLATRKKFSEKRKQYLKNPDVIENLRKHRANQVISKESYQKQAKVISSLIWMNDGNRSYRVRPELVSIKLSEGLHHGRLCNYIDEDYKKMRSEIAKNQWKAVKSKSFTGSLKGVA